MRLHLPASYGTAAARVARRAVPGDDEDLALVVTELVSNAVRHAGGDILLVIKDTDSTRRIEVWDTSVMPPRIRHAPASAECGRGLTLVDALSRTWGWTAGDGAGPWAKAVFAEMTVSPATSVSPGDWHGGPTGG